MRLSVDGFAKLLSRKALLATATAGAAALIALGAFSWKATPAAAPAEPVIRPARVAEIKFRSHMHSLMLAGTGGTDRRILELAGGMENVIRD